MIAIPYQLELVEPLLVTASGGDPNTDQSEKFVPGSAMRGALAALYLQNKKADADFTRLFLDGSVRFLNAYPVAQGGRTLPTPKAWRVQKDPTADGNEHKIYQFAEIPPANTRMGGAFVAVDEAGVVVPVTTQYEMAIHIARNRAYGRAIGEDNESAIFRYQALARGQRFAGIILTGCVENAGIFQSLLPHTLMLGGSNSAGYGLTHVTQGQRVDNWQEHGRATAIAKGDTFTLYLTSDAILRHPKTGQLGVDIAGILHEAWGEQSVMVQSAYTQMGWVGGFNTTWGLPLPQAWAVLGGSVWQLTAMRDIGEDEVVGVINAGIGDRRAEGYGTLLIGLPWFNHHSHLTLPPPTTHHNTAPYQPTFPQLNAPQQAMVNRLNQRIAQKELDRLIVTTAHQMTRNIHTKLSNSQLARLRLRIRAERQQPAPDFRGLQTYLDNSSKRKSADDQFRKQAIRVFKKGKPYRQNFRAWLLKLANNPHILWEQVSLIAPWQKEGEWERPLLGKNNFVLDDPLTRTYATRLMEAVCEQLAKGE